MKKKEAKFEIYDILKNPNINREEKNAQLIDFVENNLEDNDIKKIMLSALNDKEYTSFVKNSIIYSLTIKW